MLKPDELKLFITTAEAGSFVTAAENLGVAPSVISKKIRAMEAALGTTLFNRTTRRIAITPDGEWLLGRAQAALERLQEINGHFRAGGDEPHGRLCVDAASSFTLHAIVPVIDRFTARYPGIDITLESQDNISDLIARHVDLAIRIGDLPDSTLKARRIGTTRRAIYAAPAYLDRYGRPETPDDLQHHRCLGFTRPEHLNRWPLPGPDGDHLAVAPAMRAGSGETLKQLTLHGNGIACLSDFTARPEEGDGRLVRLLEGHLLAHQIPVHAVHQSGRDATRNVRLFLDFLVDSRIFSPV